MDTTDPAIRFNAAGESHYVEHFREEVLPRWNPEGDVVQLERLVARIKAEGVGADYDCILGLSGGLDSSYACFLAWKHGLRPLVVHTDTGWNSEVAVGNINALVRAFGFDLVTAVVPWPEMRDLQRAFLQAGVPNQDIPQDHAIFAAFYRTAARHGIRWVLSGRNFASESVLPPAWGHDAGDLRHLRSIHRRFGASPLREFPTLGYMKNILQLRMARRMRFARPLDLIKYERAQAIRVLQKECDWRDYGGKHYESRFTKFFQGWYLPMRYGYDKRLAHYSSLILSQQITRAAALTVLSTSAYPPSELADDKHFIRRKLGFSETEFEDILRIEPRKHSEYRSSQQAVRLLGIVRAGLRRVGAS